MTEFDTSKPEQLLRKLDAQGALFPEFTFSLENGQMCLLGKGGFSLVYAMESRRSTNDRYALKVTGFERQLQNSADFYNASAAQRSLLEQTPYVVRILGIQERYIRLDEAGNILQIRDTAENDSRSYDLHLQLVLMERLSDLLVRDKFGKITLANPELESETGVLEFALQIGNALFYAHNNRILHRDIKLENIFWDAEAGCYKLGDFGAAKLTHNGSAETKVYTDGYGAPEIERALTGSYGPEADIYSFGMTLYLLLNELCFPGSEGYRANSIQYDPQFVFPAPKNASVPMTRLLRKMCSYHPSDRCRSMAEVLTELQEIAEHSSVQMEKELPPIPDLETEYYQETSPAPQEEKEESRESRILKQRAAGRNYRNAALRIVPGAFLLMLPVFANELPSQEPWSMWVLALLLILEAALCTVRELSGLAGWLIAGFVLWSGWRTGWSGMHVAALICLMSGNPLHLCVLGVSLCVGLLIPGDALPVLGWFSEKGLSWLLAGPLYACGLSLAKKKRDAFGDDWEFNLLVNVPLVIGVIGLLLRGAALLQLLPLPDFVPRFRPIAVGIGCFVCLCILLSRWGIDEGSFEEASENKQSLDTE